MATATAQARPEAPKEASDWVDAFAAGWAAGGPADRFYDHFEPWLDPEVRLIQPQLPTLVGHRQFRENFVRPLFGLVPDLLGTVEGWASREDVVYVALRLEGTIGRRSFELPTVDRVTLRDGKAIERIAYANPAPLLRAVALSPSTWPRFIRMQIASRKKGNR